MRKFSIIFVLAAIFSIPASFADDQDMSDSPACATIAKACLSAGFVRTATPAKRFWQDCMKPIILGQTVSGVTIDATTVRTCRTDKIEALKKELEEFQKIS